MSDPRRIQRIRIATMIVLCGFAVFTATAVHALFYAPESEAVVPLVQTATATTSTAKPSRLIIPSIGVDADIRPVGISYRGNMMTPDNFSDVGWYKYGTLPGQHGSAVIDGHVDNGLSFPGVFKRLKEMQIGQDVYIQTEAGQRLHFRVVDVQTYYYTSAPLQTIFNRDDTVRLNLITCDGDWVPEDQTDDHRVVVYTELVTD